MRETMSLKLSNNSTTNETLEQLGKGAKKGHQTFTIDLPFICLFCLGVIVLTSGIAGNASVLIIIKRNRTFQTAQNYLLANLAAADITSLLFCAFTIIPMLTVLPGGVPATILCKFFVGFNVPLTTTVTSVFTLTVLAVERYNAVVKPLQTLQRGTTRYTIMGTWLASIALNAPLFAHTDYKFKKAFCHQTYSGDAELTHITFYTVFVFIIPFIIVCFCYSKIVKTLYHGSATVTPASTIPDKEKLRQKKQLLKMSLTVTAVFAGCVFPASITVLLRYFRLVSQTVRAFGLLLLFLSSVVNPFIYAFHSLNYRCAFKALFKCKSALDQN